MVGLFHDIHEQRIRDIHDTREVIMKINAVFQGGGVRAIGQAGAVEAFEEAGFEFENVCGASGGALVASLLATGHSSTELKQILSQLNLKRFRSSPAIFAPIRIFRKLGLFGTHHYEEWLNGLFAAKNKAAFGDLKTVNEDGSETYKLKVVTVDVTTRQIITLPDDLDKYGIDKDSFSVAKAVRMSSGIPLFYEPAKLVDKDGVTHFFIDGGVLSNFPFWLINDGGDLPLYGFKYAVDTSLYTKKTRQIGLKKYIEDMIECWQGNCGGQCPMQSEMLRGNTVNISVVVEHKGKKKNVAITYFNIRDDEKKQLYQNGYNAAKAMLNAQC